MIILLEIREQTTSPEKLERAQYLMALNLAQYQFPTWVFKGWKIKQFWSNHTWYPPIEHWCLPQGGVVPLFASMKEQALEISRDTLWELWPDVSFFLLTAYEFPCIQSGTVPMPVGRRWQKARKPWEVQIWWGENSGPPEDFQIRNLLSFLNFPIMGDVGCGCSKLVSRSRFPIWG